MTMSLEPHWDHTICEDTLAALAYSRSGLLTEKGMDRQAAHLFALQETAKRQELAKIVGADAALLARLEWVDRGGMGISCRLVPDDAPENIRDQYIFEFELFSCEDEDNPLLA